MVHRVVKLPTLPIAARLAITQNRLYATYRLSTHRHRNCTITELVVDPRKQLGLQIRELRLRLELSQEQLAEKCRLHRTYVGAVERGERNLSLVNIVKLANALGVSPSELLSSVK